MRHTPCLVVLLIAGSLLGCQFRQTIAYPTLAEPGPTEVAFDCAALDDAILKTDAVRWVMREDGARLLSPDARAARATADAVTAVVGAVGLFVPVPGLGQEGHVALDRADHRLLALLKLKETKRCAARPTALPGVTDLELHDRVSALIEKESQEGSSQVGELRAERTRLLDSLRPAPSRPPDNPHLPASPSTTEEKITAIGLESGHAIAELHLEPFQDLAHSRIDSSQVALISFPGGVPEFAVDPGHAGGEPVALDRAQDRARVGIDLVDLSLPVLAHPERAFGPGGPRVTPPTLFDIGERPVLANDHC